MTKRLNEEIFVRNLRATYMSHTDTLRIYHNNEQIFEQSVERCPDLDYWNYLTFGEDEYDINLHHHDGRLSLQMYPVHRGSVNCSIWQNIEIKVLRIL